MTTYYVDATGGSDPNSGTSEGQAWQTLGKVRTEFIAGTFGAGDRIKLKRGETWTVATSTDCLEIQTCSGALGDPIVIESYGTGALPVIDANGVLNLKPIVHRSWWNDANHILIQDIEVTGVHDTGAIYAEKVHHWFLEDLYVHDVTAIAVGGWAAAIRVKSDSEYVWISGCTITTIDGEGIYVGDSESATDNTRLVVIKDCDISYCDSEAVDLKDLTRSCFVYNCDISYCGIGDGGNHDYYQVSIGGYYHVVYQCTINGTRGSNRSGIYIGRYQGGTVTDSGRYCRVERCLITNCDGSYGGVYCDGDNNEIIGCTIASCSHAIYGGDVEAAGGYVIKNNIFHDITNESVYLTVSESRFDFDHNCYSDGATGVWYESGASRNFSYVQGTLGQEASGITTAANFAETTNYTLNSGSGCINAGDSSETVYDWEDEYTPSGSVDIGWKEYGFTEPHRVFSTFFNSVTFERFTGYSGVDYSTAVTPVAGSGVLRANITDQTDRYAYRSVLGGLQHFFLSFYVDVDSLTMGSGDEFSVVEMRQSGNVDVVRVRIQYDGANVRVRAGVIDDSDSWTYTSYFNLGAGWNRIEVFWLGARDTSVNDGALVLWLDGTEEAIIEDLNNHDDSVDRLYVCLLYTSPSPRDRTRSRMPSSA